MPALKGTEASLSYIQCFLYLVSSSKNARSFHITWLDTSWTDLVFIVGCLKIEQVQYRRKQVLCDIFRSVPFK